MSIYGPCQTGKQNHEQHKRVQKITTTKVLDLIHMDLMEPMHVESIARKKYVLVCVDDFSRFIRVEFLQEKSEAFESFILLCLRVEVEKDCIRTSHGREFENEEFLMFCNNKSINHELSVAKTPQHNGLMERKNRTLQGMARPRM